MYVTLETPGRSWSKVLAFIPCCAMTNVCQRFGRGAAGRDAQAHVESSPGLGMIMQQQESSIGRVSAQRGSGKF